MAMLAGASAAVTVDMKMITKSVPAACGDPAAIPDVSVSDEGAIFWFRVTGAKTGDVAASEWVDPDGQPYSGTAQAPLGGPWNTLTSDGTWCFQEALLVAGNPPASKPGVWTVKVSWNGQPLFTMPVFVTTPYSGGGLKLDISQVITSACPTIKLIASVLDEQGRPVTGLGSSNFVLREDGQVRPVTVKSGGAAQLNVAILIDASGSLSPADLANEKAAAKELIAQLGAGSAVSIYEFSSFVNHRQALTTDLAAASRAIDAIADGGSTALYDAIVAGAQEMSAVNGRKVIVLMTDGEDTASYADLDAAVAQALKAGTPVYPVGFGRADQAILTEIANRTGGKVSASATSGELSQLLKDLGQVIAVQYEITYTSGDPTIDHGISLTASSGSSQSAPQQRTTAACAASASGVLLTVESASGSPGQTVDVPVTLHSVGQAPASFQMDVAFDTSKLTFNSARAGDELAAAGKDVANSTPEAGKLRIVGAGFNQSTIGNGTVAFLTFTLNGGFVAGGSTPLACSEPMSVNPAGQALKTTCVSGKVTSVSSCGCDMNGDGAINVGDVQTVVNRSLGLTSGGCDLNGDGQVNVGDVQIVVNASLGLGCKK